MTFCRIVKRRGEVVLYDDQEDAWAHIAQIAAHGVRLVGVVGSRRRNTEADRELVNKAILREYAEHGLITVVSGACPIGADTFAAEFARRSRFPLVEFPAEWNKYGRWRAGHLRNEHIARCCDVLYALPHQDRKGGTEGTIEWAERLGRQVVLL